jgi:hypothetical protein
MKNENVKAKLVCIKEQGKRMLIERALGVIEGVMLTADERTMQALTLAVEMIDEALSER